MRLAVFTLAILSLTLCLVLTAPAAHASSAREGWDEATSKDSVIKRGLKGGGIPRKSKKQTIKGNERKGKEGRNKAVSKMKKKNKIIITKRKKKSKANKGKFISKLSSFFFPRPFPSSSLRNPSRKRIQVFIGGAGYSGISAANELQQQQITFSIVEARPSIGGRMKVTEFGTNPQTGQPYVIEQGANWIQSLEGNPAWDEALKVGLGGNIQNFDNALVYDQNGNLDLFETDYEDGSNCGNADYAYVESGVLSERCFHPNEGDVLDEDDMTYCKGLLGDDFGPQNNDDLSSADGETLATGFDVKTSENPAVARVCQYFSQDFEYAYSPKECSLNNTIPVATYNDFEDADYWVGDQRGFKILVESMAATFLKTKGMTPRGNYIFRDRRLSLNSKVIHVQWDPTGTADVVVTLCKTANKKLDGVDFHPCIPGTEYYERAENFLSTFPLGVLEKIVELETDTGGAGRRSLKKNDSVDRSSIRYQKKDGPGDASEMTDSRIKKDVESRSDITEGSDYEDETTNHIRRLVSTRDIAPVFDPPLTSIPGFANGLANYGMNAYYKLFFQFPFQFWPDDTEILLSAHSNGTFIGDYAPIFHLLDINNETSGRFFDGSNMLDLHLGGDRAEDLNDKTDQEIQEEILVVLNQMFGDEIRAQNNGNLLQVSDVLAFEMYRWRNDRCAYGSYSTFRFGSTIESVEALRGLYGNLMFSGEHTCFRLNGFVHGGLLSGRRSARILMKERYGLSGLEESSFCDVAPSEIADMSNRRLATEEMFRNAGMNYIPKSAIRHSRGYPREYYLTEEDIDMRFALVGTSRPERD